MTLFKKINIAAVVVIAIIVGLNMSGYCWGTKSWLSGQRKIDLAVGRLINSANFSSNYLDLASGTNRRRSEVPVKYLNLSDFYKKTSFAVK